LRAKLSPLAEKLLAGLGQTDQDDARVTVLALVPLAGLGPSRSVTLQPEWPIAAMIRLLALQDRGS
jgi:hypothetical protein